MNSRKSLLLSIPAVLGMALAGLIPAAHAAPPVPPPAPLVNVTAAAGYYQAFIDAVATTAPEDLVVAVKDRANNAIVIPDANVVFTSNNPAVSFVTNPAVATLDTNAIPGGTNEGFYVLPKAQILIAANTSAFAQVATVTATVSVPGFVYTVSVPFRFVLYGGGSFVPFPSLFGYVDPAVGATPAGFSATVPPPTQVEPMGTFFPRQDEAYAFPIFTTKSGLPVTFTIIQGPASDPNAPAGTLTNARFSPNDPACAAALTICTVLTTSDGVATDQPINAGTVPGTFTVQANLVGAVFGPIYSYVVTGPGASVCQIVVNAFANGGSDAIALRTGDQGPEVSLNSGTLGPISPSSPISNPAARNYPVFNLLNIGLQSGTNVVDSTPIVPKYTNDGSTNPDYDTSTLTCSASTPPQVIRDSVVLLPAPSLVPVPALLITVTATFQSLVSTSGRPGVSKGDVLGVTVTKSGYLPNARGLTQVVSETVTITDLTTGGASIGFGGGFSVAPQNFFIKLDNTLY